MAQPAKTLNNLDSLVEQLKSEYSTIHFKPGETFKWSADKKTIYYSTEVSENATITLLHEVGHALLNHSNFDSDLDLLGKEIEAWELAIELAEKYKIEVDEDYVNDCLESYRNWLHQRSVCPKCEHSVFQGSDFSYSCPNCRHSWRTEADQFCGGV